MTLTVGLLGAGGIASVHLPAWLARGARVQIFAPEGADELSAAQGGEVVGSVDEALAGVDVVDVCTPTPTHAELVLAALDARVTKIVCEKPLGRTADQARTMITAAEAAGARLYPGHVVRYFDEYATMHAAVAAGTIGAVAVQRFTRTGTAPGPGWFHDDALSGGIVLDQMIHDLDFARWNAGEVSTVFARDVAVGTVRTASVILTHVGGAISTVVGTWAPPGTPFRTTFEIAGELGLLSHDSTAHRPVVVSGGTIGGTGLLPPAVGQSPYAAELFEFAAAFEGGPAPRVSARDGLAAVIIAEAALESVASGTTITLCTELEAWA